jgi:GTPase SAR1 family protein
LFDTAGHETFKVITSSYVGLSDSILLVYNVCNDESEASVKNRVGFVRKYSQAQIFLVANKIELVDDANLKQRIDST